MSTLNRDRKYVLLGFLCLWAANASAQSVEKEPIAVVELGGAAETTVQDGSSSFGPTVAVEITPIENWLELEGELLRFSRVTQPNGAPTFCFKKPWTLSKKAEFMLGVGPEWVHATKYGITTNSISGEVVLDFMFWPSAKHRFGWYVEPGYDYSFGRGHEQSFGISGGLLIAIR